MARPGQVFETYDAWRGAVDAARHKLVSEAAANSRNAPKLGFPGLRVLSYDSWGASEEETVQFAVAQLAADDGKTEVVVVVEFGAHGLYSAVYSLQTAKQHCPLAAAFPRPASASIESWGVEIVAGRGLEGGRVQHLGLLAAVPATGAAEAGRAEQLLDAARAEKAQRAA